MNNDCPVCEGKHSCVYCQSIHVPRPSLKELELIDLYYNGGRIAVLSVDAKRHDVAVEFVEKAHIPDLGSIITAQTTTVDQDYHPFWPEAGSYRKIFAPHLKKGEKIGRVISTPTRIFSNSKTLTKLVGIEVIKDETCHNDIEQNKSNKTSQ